eukprot:3165963-Amphidinium_carterae.1
MVFSLLVSWAHGLASLCVFEETLLQLKDASTKASDSYWTRIGNILETHPYWKKVVDDFLAVAPLLVAELPKINADLATLAGLTDFSEANIEIMNKLLQALPGYRSALPDFVKDLDSQLLAKVEEWGEQASSLSGTAGITQAPLSSFSMLLAE